MPDRILTWSETCLNTVGLAQLRASMLTHGDAPTRRVETQLANLHRSHRRKRLTGGSGGRRNRLELNRQSFALVHDRQVKERRGKQDD